MRLAAAAACFAKTPTRKIVVIDASVAVHVTNAELKSAHVNPAATYPVVAFEIERSGKDRESRISRVDGR